MSKVLLCTFASDRFGRKGSQYGATQIKVELIFKNNSQFGITDFWMMTWEDLIKTEFYQQNKVMLDNVDPGRNGRLFKPFLISEALKSVEEGDYIVYNDVSPELWNIPVDYQIPGTYNIEVIKNLCDQNNGILSVFVKWDTRHIPKGLLGVHTHANFTLDRCINKMDAWKYRDSFQHASGMMVFRKSPNTTMFVEEWLRYNRDPECSAMGHPDIPDDYSYWDAEDYKKLGSRADQSISGILINKYNYKLVDIVHTELNPYNFLNFCRTDKQYEFIDSNYNPDTRPRLRKGDKVINQAGQELQIFEIWPEDGKEVYYVGKHRQSMYKAYEQDLKIKE